jgi:hypothetical protein
MQSCINFGTCLVEGRVPKACSSRVQKHVSVVSKVLRLTWLLEHAFGTLPSTKKSAKINAGLRPVAATRAVNQRPGGRAKAKAKAGRRARRGRAGAARPRTLRVFFPSSHCIQTYFLFPFDAMNGFPQHYQFFWHAECCCFSVCMCVYD